MANMDSSKPARLAFLEFDEDLYGRKIKEKDGVTYKIIPYSAGVLSLFLVQLKSNVLIPSFVIVPLINLHM